MIVERKRVVITGGCGDIGLATASQLVDDGYAVTLVDILDENVAQQRMQESGKDICRTNHTQYLRADVSDHGAMKEVVESLDRIDVMIANAGIGRSSPILDLSHEEWEAHLSINLTGAFNAGQAGAQRMVRDKRKGLLLFTSSFIGSVPWPEMTAYISSKAGIEMLAKQFARELASHGIRSNIIAPGVVRAGMAKVQLENEPQYVERVSKVVPLDRLETVDDVANAISFLCSPNSSYMTGSKLTVDGGCSLFAFDKP